MTQGKRAAKETSLDYDVVVVGAGFAGMYALHKLRGLGFAVQVFEAGDGVGGTWFWNRYPGCRCDVESMYYSYSFSEELEQEWHWTERYPTQPEILAYANHVADRFDLRRDIRFETRVLGATYDEGSGSWAIETDRGDRVRARFLVTAVGCLSAWQIPDFPGLDSYTGETYHTGNWPQEGVDLTGKRVGVIGTGSSGIQVIPMLAEQAGELYVFQRTANFSVPANQRPLAPSEERELKERYPEVRAASRLSAVGIPLELATESALEVPEEERRRRFEAGWGVGGGAAVLGTFNDLAINEEANKAVVDFVHSQIRNTVTNPAVAELLCPKDHPMGSKRLCVDTNYYETFNQPNVTLVDVKETPIERISEHGLIVGGTEYTLDAIVFATGYDAMTGPLMRLNIRGRQGRLLNDEWQGGPRTYLGLQVAGFPNLFTITGPGSPSVLSNMIVSIEQHVDFIADALAYLREHRFETMEATPRAQEDWVAHVGELAGYTLYPKGNSWYLGANIPGKPRVFMPYVGGVGAYRLKCDEVAANGYEGFVLHQAGDPEPTDHRPTDETELPNVSGSIV